MKEKFAVPVLAIKVGDLIEQLEETHFLDCEWKLSKCDPLLTEEEFPTRRPEGKRGEIDITKGGQIETRFLSDLLGQVSFLGANEAWTEAELACWFDRTIPHRDITPTESGIFLARLVRALIDERRLSLAQLVLDKYRLRQAVEARIEKHRSAANRQAFQSLLFPEEDSAIMVTPERCFTYDPLQYAYSSIYRGSYKWQKHYYDQIGDLKAEGEEFECAVFLDQMPEVARWVRNLERRPSTSFWLPTSSGRFYPDFVCQLNDGRSLVVEYKGGHLWGDAKEKRDLGGVWGKRSGGRCLFIMLKEKNFDAIRAKIRSPKS
jgi:type III restriction enzyme